MARVRKSARRAQLVESGQPHDTATEIRRVRHGGLVDQRLSLSLAWTARGRHLGRWMLPIDVFQPCEAVDVHGNGIGISNLESS